MTAVVRFETVTTNLNQPQITDTNKRETTNHECDASIK